jgi:sigma-B regulation protein RsbU (phosphoserine phosphatase)
MSTAGYLSIALTFVFTFAFLPLLAHFALVFPRERPSLSERPHILHWTYASVVFPLAVLSASLVALVLDDRAPWAGWALAAGLVGATAWAWGPGRRGARRLRERPWAATLAGTTVFFACGWLASLGADATWAKAARVMLLAVGLGLPFIVLFASLFVLPAFAVTLLIRSYRDSGLEERQQIRWPLWALVFSLASTVLLSGIAIVVASFTGADWTLRWQVPFEIVTAVLYLAIPVGFAVGLLKYRLLDLDVVIRKTAVYGAVTSLMIVLYLVLAGFLGGWIVQSLRVQSTWVTVIATLAVVAVFVPARNRVQAIVDRRFFRTRYEAPESLGRLSRALGTATDARGFGAAAADELMHALRPRAIAILAAHRDDRSLEPVAVLGVAEDRAGELTLPRSAALAATAPTDIVAAEATAGPIAIAARAARAKLVVPVRRQGELLGLILLGSKVSDEDYDPHDLEYLGAVAGQLAIGFGQTLSHVHRRELDEAREIQAGLLPRALPRLPGLALAAHWQPAREVAGDYYDVLSLGDDRAALCIADVTGKGMPAALLMSNLQATVKTFAATAESPDVLCRRVNRIMAANMAQGRFITFFYGVLDAATRTLAYTNAGHNPPLLLRRDGTCEALETGGLLLGAFPDAEYAQARIELRAGDRLVLFTDGLVEAESATRELYGDERLLAILRRHATESAEELQRRILAAAAEHCGGEFQDDATLIVIAVD